MKGSPILTTALACLIMLSMYLGMRMAFSDPTETLVQPSEAPEPISDNDQTSTYIEIYFSSLPKKFSLTHPATGKTLLEVDHLESPEWSGDVILPLTEENLTSEEIEIQGKAEWKLPETGYQFMQVIISPSKLDPQSQTLRSEFNISDIMTFHWKEQQ